MLKKINRVLKFAKILNLCRLKKQTMDTKEILQKVRKIEIKTRRLTKNIFAGEYHSSFKGRGMTFSEVREYQYGDDIRNIDWNVTARYNHPYIKTYEEERELTVMLLIDLSASGAFGSYETKRNYLAELAAVIAFSALQNNDKVGVIFFTDRIEKFIRPQKGKSHILLIIRELLAFEPEGKGTDVGLALKYLTSSIKKKATVFVVSDFLSPDFSKPLKISAYKHDISAFFVYDKLEIQLPNIGIINAFDPETNQTFWINTSSQKQRKLYEQFWNKHEKTVTDLFKKSNVDFVKLATDSDYVVPLVKFFKNK